MNKIKCPNCDKELPRNALKDLPSFPFCCNKCKLIDLGQWFDEDYKIESTLNPPIAPAGDDEF